MEQTVFDIHNRTKIIATIGPASNSYGTISQLIEAGARLIRLNLSHGTHEYHENIIKLIKRFNRKEGYNIAIILDTKGPEIRTSDIPIPLQLKKNDRITLTVEYTEYEHSGKIRVSYDTFINDVEVGEKILVDNGIMNFVVEEKTEKDVICRVLDGGELASRRHLNLPGRQVSLDSITEKDWVDIDFAIAQGVDYIALSFVRCKEDIYKVSEYLQSKHAHIGIIAKIENSIAIDNIEELCEASDAVMVARGDLGAEVPFEDVPRLQRMIVGLCSQKRTPVIVATHMLESMINNPIPTRAETADISTAVWQRVDGIMLSGETAGGAWPVKSVEAMGAIAQATEAQISHMKEPIRLAVTNQRENIVDLVASCITNDPSIGAVFVVTRSGYMAGLTAALRLNVPIIAFTNEPRTKRKVQLYHGVTAYRIAFSSNPETTIQRAELSFLKRFPKWKGESYILISDFIVKDELIPTLQIRILKQIEG